MGVFKAKDKGKGGWTGLSRHRIPTPNEPSGSFDPPYEREGKRLLLGGLFPFTPSRLTAYKMPALVIAQPFAVDGLRAHAVHLPRLAQFAACSRAPGFLSFVVHRIMCGVGSRPFFVSHFIRWLQRRPDPIREGQEIRLSQSSLIGKILLQYARMFFICSGMHMNREMAASSMDKQFLDGLIALMQRHHVTPQALHAWVSQFIESRHNDARPLARPSPPPQSASTSSPLDDDAGNAVAALLARYQPVRLERRRGDGWTTSAQRHFLGALAEGASVAEAARAAGMGERAAYKLRRHPLGHNFAAAWNEAQDLAATIAAEKHRAQNRPYPNQAAPYSAQNRPDARPHTPASAATGPHSPLSAPMRPYRP